MSDTLHLKSHREGAKKTQADIAAIISESSGQSVTQGQVSRWEENPDTIPPRLLRTFAQALGLTLDELYEVPLGRDGMRVDAGDPYVLLRRNVSVLRACLDAAPAATDAIGIPEPSQVEALCARVERKPNVVLAGHFDSGKSRICNALLGTDILPERYQPTTSAGTWMVHVDDRPLWCDHVVSVYGKGFEPYLLRDRTHCDEFRVASGGLEILSAYVAHPKGGRAAEEFTVVAYLDAPVLRGCNLLDVPGTQSSDADTRAAGAALARADILIYVSRSIGFLDESDVVHLRAQLRQLPLLEARGVRPLENLFIVASHAHPGIRRGDLDILCDDGARTIMRELGETVFPERTTRSSVAITEADVRRRIFPFWFETPDRREPLRKALADTLGVTIPPAWLRGADDEVEAFRQRARGSCEASIRQYQRVLADIDAATRDLVVRRTVDDAGRRERDARRQTVLHAMHAQWQGAKLAFVTTWPSIVNDAAVEAFIKNRYQNKKDAEKHAAGAVIDHVQSVLGKDAAVRADQLVPMIQEFVGQYGGGAGDIARRDGSPSVDIAFDARGAFLGGMAGLSTVGALGAWASTLGNLGGYIIVAKVASLLAALGIETGGSAALVTLVSALGGPAVVAVALAVVLALGIGWLFGESWQSRLAKKIVKTLEKNDVRAKFQSSVDAYWTGTQVAFDQGAHAVEAEYQRHLDDLSRVVTASAQSPDDLQRLISSLERIRDFFAGLPWKVST